MIKGVPVWILNIYYRAKLKYILSQVKSRHTLNRTICIKILEMIDIDKFIIYKPSKALNILVYIRYTNIEEYINKIKATNLLIKKGNNIPSNWDVVEEELITLDRFLISNDGFYIDIKKAVENFKIQSLELCNLMEESDNAEYGIHEHNARMLNKLFNNIILVSTKLIELTIK